MPGVQRTQGIESLTCIIFLAKFVSIYVVNSSFRLNCWGPLCHHLNWLHIWPLDGVTCINNKFGHQMAPLLSIANLPPDGATRISCKLGHQMAPLALVANLATRWRYLHKLQIWPPDGATCISCKFGHQMAPLSFVANLATRWRHLH